MSSPVCPACGPDQSSWDPAFELTSGSYVACRRCGLLRLEPFPDPDDATALYGDGYFEAAEHGGYADYVADEGLHRRNARRRLGHIGGPPRPGAVLVDVGCAHGYTMDESRSVGWEPVGVEVNERARHAVRAAGMTAVESLADVQVAPGGASALSFFQSLEHLPDVAGAVEAAALLLEPGGRLVIETWNRESLVARLSGRRWQQLTPPSVLWVFGRDDLAVILDRAGLSLDRYGSSMKWVSAATVLGQLEQRSDGGAARRAFERGSRMVGRLPLPYALGDLVTLTATRR